MHYKIKKGYISIEYIVVAGIILTSVVFIFITQLSANTHDINTKTQNIINIISSDEN